MAGKIDILTYKKDTNELFIIQIKPHNSNDTLLRTVLEIQTMDKDKLVDDYYSIDKISFKNPKIKKVLVFENCATADREYNWCMGDMTTIIEDLQIEVLQIE